MDQPSCAAGDGGRLSSEGGILNIIISIGKMLSAIVLRASLQRSNRAPCSKEEFEFAADLITAQARTTERDTTIHNHIDR